MKEYIYSIVPNFMQNIIISIYNIKAYRERCGGEYSNFRTKIKNNRNLTREELVLLQKERYKEFIKSSIDNSLFYNRTLSDIPNVTEIDSIKNLPIVDKEILRANIKDVVIVSNEILHMSKTGGTTGKSLEVMSRGINCQERFAMLDDFRSRFGYELGKKTAWFSGKNILNKRDVKRNRFWKTDFFYNVRYYSTFHINNSYLEYYLKDLISYKAEFFVGFPSTIFEIAKFGLEHGYDYPINFTKAIFPTAETVTEEMRGTIEKFFKCKMYNQYASSEGAPFIFECNKGNLHLELQSGVFEVLDSNDEDSRSGRLIVTSFTTEATPLIRYDIGDSIILEDESVVCSCGNHNPLVREILGRSNDYIYSPEMGKINLGNVSNTLKGIYGVIKFQVIQRELDKIMISIVCDRTLFDESAFLSNWRARVGHSMVIEISYVDDICVESSGKYRLVKNYIKDIIE